MFRVKKQVRTLICAMALAGLCACAGCFRQDPVAMAIKRLGGNDVEKRQAVMDLRLTSFDPVPQLCDAAGNSREKLRVRIAALEVLGDIARRQKNEEALAFLHQMLSVEDPELCEAAVKGFVDSEYTNAVPDLIALRHDASPELLTQIEQALESTSWQMVYDIEKEWNSPEAAMQAYADAEKIGLDRGVVGYSKARFLEMRGRREEAAAQYDKLGVIRRYWLIGAFPNYQGTGFRVVYPPEQEVVLDKEYPSFRGLVSWYKMERDLYEGRLNFEAYFVETDNVVGYTAVFLVTDREQPIEVRAGSDDTLQLYLNNEVVYENEEYRAVKYDDDIVPLTLPAGTNSLVFKVTEDWGGWMLLARITGPGDTPLEDVEITLDP